jgi:hypothetical protein
MWVSALIREEEGRVGTHLHRLFMVISGGDLAELDIPSKHFHLLFQRIRLTGREYFDRYGREGRGSR